MLSFSLLFVFCLYVRSGEALLFSFFLVCLYVGIDGALLYVCERVRKRECGRERESESWREGERECGVAGRPFSKEEYLVIHLACMHGFFVAIVGSSIVGLPRRIERSVAIFYQALPVLERS